MTLEPSMKRFLACVATVLAICLPVSVIAQEDNSAGRVRLSDDQAPPPPIPHVIGSDDTGRVVVDDGGSALPMPSSQYSEYIGAGPDGVGYQMSNNVFTVQYRLDRRFGGLYGYDDGFTDIGVFIPQIVDDNTIFFYDLRGFVTDNSDGGFNFGVGRRSYDAYADRVWSHSLWLDYDGGHVDQYLRGGYSGSMTSRYLRYRWNGYWILGDQNNFVGTSFGDTPFYSGSSLQLGRTRTREVAYSGFDATVGGPIPLLGRYGLNWDFGMYYNGAEFGEDGFGFLAKADAQLTEDISLGVSYADDKVFGSNAQMNLAINLPDGRSRRILRQPRVHDYMLRPDDRNYRIATERYQVEDSLAAQYTGTGNDLNIAHIIPDAEDGATPSGDGTIENPFNSLAAWEQLSDAEKSAYHIVLVRPGSDVTLPNGTYQANLNTGITIGENQRLLASTGRLVRSVENDADVIRYAAHTVDVDIAGFGSGLTYSLPDTDALAGTIFDPTTDPRPILSNHVNPDDMLPNTMYNVVSIDENIIGPCPMPMEVSGFIIDGWNPYTDGIPDNDTYQPGDATEPIMYNNGIVTLTDVSSFDINSNFIRDAVHAVDINSQVDGSGYTVNGEAIGSIDLNQIEGAGFYSNSGIDVDHSVGTLNLNVQDNVVYHIYGEDIDNDGELLTTTDLGGVLQEDGIVNLNGKLDIGEDINGDGLLSVAEDNDKDGVISSDDHGIAINIVARDGATINSNIADVVNADGSITPGYNISRNTTWIDEAELGRDVNGYVNSNNVNTADTIDIIGNRSGINLEANNGGIFNASVADNDTSNNNPWSDTNAAGDFVPPAKNQNMTQAPDPRIPQVPELDGDGTGGNLTNPILGNGFGFRSAANGAGSTMTLTSPDRHLSNNNYGNGAVFSARNGGTFQMLSPMLGEFEVDDDGKINNVVAASEYNNNGLEGLLINGDGAGSSLHVLVGAPLSSYTEDDALTTDVNEAENVDTLAERLLNEFNGNGTRSTDPEAGNGVFISMTDGATLTGGIFGSDISSNAQDGIAFNVNNATVDNFGIDNNRIASNGYHGIDLNFEDAPTTGLTISNNEITNVGPATAVNPGDGIHMELVNSSMTDFSILNNTISQNADQGIEFIVDNSDLYNTLIQENVITENGGDGFSMIDPDFVSTAADTNHLIFSLNEINNNEGHGINISLDEDNRLDTVICVNDISGNSLGGINVELSDDAYFDNGSFELLPLFSQGNSFSGNTIDNNGGIGYHILAEDSSTFELIGSNPLTSSVSGNQDAGIGIQMPDNATGTLILDNIIVDGTLDDDNGTIGEDTAFNGDGIAILMNGSSRLTDVRIGDLEDLNTSLSDNFGDGLRVDIRSQSRIIDGDADDYGMIVSNVIASNNGNGNSFGVGNGMSFARAGDSLYEGVWIRGSQFEENNGDGIDIAISGGANSYLTGLPFAQNFLIGGPDEELDGNLFIGNAINQIDMVVQSDAILNADIENNIMFGEGDTQTTAGDGIEATAINFGQILGTWEGNAILNSGTHGISLVDNGASEGVPTPAGAVPRFNVSIYDNVIQESGTDGINMTGNATELVYDDQDIDAILRIDNNLITENGNDGIRIFADTNSEFLIQTMDGNQVGLNGRNGLSLEAEGSGDIYVYQVVDNVFSGNENHGVNVLFSHPNTSLTGVGGNIRVARLSGDTATTPGSGTFVEDATSGFVDNIVTDNGQNGYNVVLENGTGGNSMTVRIAGTVDPTVTNGEGATSLIAGNGGNGIRLESNVGATDKYAEFNASIVNNAVIGNGTKTLEAGETRDELNGIYLKAGTSTAGETSASFVSNYVSGSGNTDFVFHTFAATPDPATQNDNSPTSLQVDPLARVNIEFVGNEGGSLDVMRDSDEMQLNGNATYDNADQWKSPSYYFNGANSSGTSRARNATRLTWDETEIIIEDDSFGPVIPPNPTATSVTVAGLPNRNWAGAQIESAGGQTFDVVSSSFNAQNGQTTLTLVNNRNGATPNAGNYEIYFPSVAGVGDSTLQLFGSNALTLETSGANAAGNNFTTVITDFNDFGALGPIGSSDPFNVPGQDQYYEFDTSALPPPIFQP